MHLVNGTKAAWSFNKQHPKLHWGGVPSLLSFQTPPSFWQTLSGVFSLQVPSIESIQYPNLQYEATSQDEEILIVKKEVKKRRDAIEIYEKANETGRVKKEKEELEILSTFLPPEMDETKLKEIVSQTIKDLSAEGMKDMGKVIGAVMAKTSGQADGAKVSEIVRSLLS